VSEITEALGRGEQAADLLQPRGYSFAVICRACGEKLECRNCAISLTHHKPPAEDAGIAREGQRLGVPLLRISRGWCRRGARSCDSEHLYYLGADRNRARSGWRRYFRGARIGRMDRDTVRGRHDLERLLARLHSGEINLLVGTQMIAKGHDIHGITLVGVWGAITRCRCRIFAAAERVFQLMTQVSGRAGVERCRGAWWCRRIYPDHYADCGGEYA